jgi:hypothetical protein
MKPRKKQPGGMLGIEPQMNADERRFENHIRAGVVAIPRNLHEGLSHLRSSAVKIK